MADHAIGPSSGWRVIGRLLRRAFAALVLIVASIYVVDYGVLRYRIAASRSPFSTVTVRPYYAVPQKNRKTEFLLGDPQQETCVHSLFPHLGDAPCWYLNKHREKRIDL